MHSKTIPLLGRRILLVDDEPLVRSGTALMLDELGHTVIEAASGLQALDALSQDDGIDLLITDFRMPDMDGMDLIERAREARPSLEAILMTGYAADDPHFEGYEIVRLEKPFSLDDLEAIVAKAN